MHTGKTVEVYRGVYRGVYRFGGLSIYRVGGSSKNALTIYVCVCVFARIYVHTRVYTGCKRPKSQSKTRPGTCVQTSSRPVPPCWLLSGFFKIYVLLTYVARGEVGAWGRVPLERWGAGVEYQFQKN